MMAGLGKTERRIEILKLLHGKKMRIGEIAEYFNVDERTIRSDVDELREGLNILGSVFKIESKHEGSQHHFYQSTVHPLVLGLNLSELLMLLKLLEEKSEAAGGEVYQNIFDSIYSQLTDYAEKILKPNLKKSYVRRQVMNVLEEEAFKKSIDYKLVFWNKSGKYIEISYLDENDQLVTADVKLIDVKNNKLKIEERGCQSRWIDYGDIAVDWSKVEYM